jgi:DNA-binding CsgD family transcriptional regulator/PAS domain-containing protein
MIQSERSFRSFSTAVEAIYDCALDAAHWKEALRLIGALTDSPFAAIGTTDYARGRHENAVFVGVDPTYVDSYREKFPVNPIISACHMRPLGEVYRLTSIISDEIVNSQFVHCWSRPQDLGDLIGVNAIRAGQRVGGLSVFRIKSSQPHFGKKHVHILRLLAPHIRRTFAISHALDLRAVTSQALEATLDALTAGVYLADREGRLVYLNRAAEGQIRAGSTLRVVDNRLVPRNSDAHSMINRAISEATSNESAIPAGGIALGLPDTEKGGLVATVLPLNQGRRRDLSRSFAATAAVFVQNPVVSPHYPGEAFGKLYRLTDAELRVVLAMAPGLGVKEAAALLGIGEVTARTHLQHVYAKTGTSKQTELLNLLKNSAPPVNLV